MVNVILTLRIVQAVLAIIVLGLAAYVVNFYNTHGYTLDSANFLVFNSIWTFLALGYLVATPMFFPNFHNRWAVLGVEAITMVFWFAGFIALAVAINGLACIGPYECPIPAARAATVFGAFEWLAWLATLGLVVHALIQYRKSEPSDAGIESGITDPAGAPDGNAVTPSGSDVEMNGGPQFENKIEYDQQHSEAPHLPQLSELGAGDEEFQVQHYGQPPIDGSGTLQMPDVGQYGGKNGAHVGQLQ